MKKVSITAVILVAIFTIILFFTKKEKYDYNKVRAKEYNVEYSLRHPVIDSLDVLYNGNKAILIRRFEIDGHAVIGEINGGSRVLTIHDIPNCKRCRNYFLNLSKKTDTNGMGKPTF